MHTQNICAYFWAWEAAVQCAPASYLHVFCSLSSSGHSLVHPSYSSPHSLPSLSLHTFHTKEKKHQSTCTFAKYSSMKCSKKRESVDDDVKLSALYEKHHHQGIMTAQHSLFLWGQRSCDVYVTCIASWRGHAPEPHATVAVIFNSHIFLKNVYALLQFMLRVCCLKEALSMGFNWLAELLVTGLLLYQHLK